jgi:DNA invertase Pin-like site-specific DNA recombinase
VLTAAAHTPRPFDVLLVDDTSRVSRDLPDAVRLLQELKFFGVRVIYISQNIDSATEAAETLIAIHGIVDSLFVKEAAHKIRRGLAGQIRRGFATGGKTYGYKTEAILDPSGRLDPYGQPAVLGWRVVVVQDEAEVIRAIFAAYGSGNGVGRIVADLNTRGVAGPRGGTWKAGAVRRVLNNERYRGHLIWGQRTYVRRPGSKAKIARTRPREEWQVNAGARPQIVDDKLWELVVARKAQVQSALPSRDHRRRLMRGRDASLHSSYLLSGFARCDECGAAIVTVTCGHGSPRYGCPNSWRNGKTACSNRMTVRAKVADPVVLQGLQTELLKPSVINSVVAQLQEAITERAADIPRRMAEAVAARDKSKRAHDRLVAAIEEGAPVSSLTPAIAARLREIENADLVIRALNEDRPRQVAVLPGWVKAELANLAGLLGEASHRAKVELKRLNFQVTLRPQLDAPRPHYVATVKSDLPPLNGAYAVVSTLDPSHLR